MSFRCFYIFSSGGHFGQLSGTSLVTLVKGYPRNIPVRLHVFQNAFTGL